MTTYIECDWCSRPIDLDDEFDPDEYNRMGFETKVDRDYVVMEATWGSGRTRSAHEFGHFHYPDCYRAAGRLLRDHASWAEARNAGPDAAATPRWTKDGELKVTELPPRREPDEAEREKRRSDAINGPGGIGWLEIRHATYLRLYCADFVTVKQVQQAWDEGALTAVPGIGPKRLQEILRALERHEHDREKGRK